MVHLKVEFIVVIYWAWSPPMINLNYNAFTVSLASKVLQVFL
jgi:hypothetical protein